MQTGGFLWFSTLQLARIKTFSVRKLLKLTDADLDMTFFEILKYANFLALNSKNRIFWLSSKLRYNFKFGLLLSRGSRKYKI